jgi:arsenate reductase
MRMKNSITLFGIPNCDTVKKARTWLEQESIPFTFHNFKKDGLKQAQVEVWLQKIDLERLINRKGTSWRALTEAQKLQADEREKAIALVLANPSLIKRPVLQIDQDINGSNKLAHVGVGFNDQQYQTIFKEI